MEENIESSVYKDVKPRLFIKVKAAFNDGEEQDLEGLGLSEDTVNAIRAQHMIYDDLYISIPHIVAACTNKFGGINFTTVDGDKWSTGEDNVESIISFMDSLAIDLTNE